MNQAGGLLKVSPDGGLLQSSTVADEVNCRTLEWPGSDFEPDNPDEYLPHF